MLFAVLKKMITINRMEERQCRKCHNFSQDTKESGDTILDKARLIQSSVYGCF